MPLMSSGIPASANSKKPKPPRRPRSAASDTITFTGVPVSASIEPACAPNTSGISSCDGNRPVRTASTTTTGSSAATAPLTLMSAVIAATNSIVSTTSRVRSVARPIEQLLAGPCRHPGSVERLADHEQRGDEQHRSVAEAGQRLVRGRARPSPIATARRSAPRCRPAPCSTRTGSRPGQEWRS